MAFKFSAPEIHEQKMLSWATVGLLVFLSAFLWAPSRDGLQGVYVLAFFLPMAVLLMFRKPNFKEYGGWPTVLALVYAGFSTASTLWGAPKDFHYFILQWCVLAVWLCGSCLIFAKHEIDTEKYLSHFVLFGILITISLLLHYFLSVEAQPAVLSRLVGWNTFRNPNEVGAFCGVIALLAFTVAIQSISLKRTWLFYIFALIAAVGLVSSLSRGALFAFLVMAGAALTIVRPTLKVWLPPALILCITILIILITTNILSAYTTGRGDGFGIRSVLWREVFDRCRENIFIGIGMSKDTTIIIAQDKAFNHAHNAWLDTLYRTGIIGLTLILAHVAKNLHNFSRDPRILPFYLWLGFGCIYNLFDGKCFFGEIGAKWFLYWIPISLITAINTSKAMRKTKGPVPTNASLCSLDVGREQP